MKIRKAFPSEWKIIQKLNYQVYESDSKNDDDLKLSQPYTKEGISYYKALTNGKYGNCLIAWEGSIPVGYVAMAVKKFSHRKSIYVEVENIGVDPKYRSKGIGRQLMLEVEKWAKKKKAAKLYLVAYFKNKRAIQFYKKSGFYEIGVELEKKIQ